MKRILFLILFVLSISQLFSQDNSYWYYFFGNKSLPVLTGNNTLVKVAPMPNIYQTTYVNSNVIGDTAWGQGTYDVLNTGLNFRIAQTGTITKIAFYVINHRVTEFNFIVMRRNASMTMDSIGASGDLTNLINAASLNQLDTFTLPNPINAVWGDFIRIQSKADTTYTKRFYAGGVDSSRIKTGSYFIGSNHNSYADTNQYRVVPIIVFMNQAPILVTFGNNSIGSGICDAFVANGSYGSQNMWDRPAVMFWNNNRVSYTDRLGYITGWTYQNSSQDAEFVTTQVLFDSIKITQLHPRVVIVSGSKNDFGKLPYVSAVEIYGAHKRIWQLCQSINAFCFDIGIMANNNFDATGEARVDSARTLISDSASRYGAHYVETKYYIAHPPTYDSMITQWKGDGTHPARQVYLKIDEALIHVMRNYIKVPNDTCKNYITYFSKTDSVTDGTIYTDTIKATGYYLPDSCYRYYTINSGTTQYPLSPMTRLSDTTSQGTSPFMLGVSTFTGSLNFDTTIVHINDTVKIHNKSVMDNSIDDTTWQTIRRRQYTTTNYTTDSLIYYFNDSDVATGTLIHFTDRIAAYNMTGFFNVAPVKNSTGILFDGNSSIYQASPTLSITTGWSYEWAGKIVDTATEQCLFAFHTTVSGFVSISSLIVYHGVLNINNNSTAGAYLKGVTTTGLKNRFIHILVTFLTDGTTHVYINGVEQSFIANNNSTNQTSDFYLFSICVGGLQRMVNGSYLKFNRFYKGALTPTQALQNWYNARFQLGL